MRSPAAIQSLLMSLNPAFHTFTPIGAVEKFSDLKLKGPAGEMLTAACEAVGPPFVVTHVHKKACGHKNPKVWRQCGDAKGGG
eukprot:50902-Chlamydomonas_euryale.AAC.1